MFRLLVVVVLFLGTEIAMAQEKEPTPVRQNPNIDRPLSNEGHGRVRWWMPCRNSSRFTAPSLTAMTVPTRIPALSPGGGASEQQWRVGAVTGAEGGPEGCPVRPSPVPIE